jgi:hypothetical protein
LSTYGKFSVQYFLPRKLFHTRAQRSMWVWKWKFSWFIVAACRHFVLAWWEEKCDNCNLNVNGCRNITEDVLYGVYAFRAFVKDICKGIFGISWLWIYLLPTQRNLNEPFWYCDLYWSQLCMLPQSISESGDKFSYKGAVSTIASSVIMKFYYNLYKSANIIQSIFISLLNYLSTPMKWIL